MNNDLTLIPTERFGRLLSRSRNASGRSIAVVAERGGERWRAADLEAIERGQRALTDSETLALLDLYELPRDTVMTNRGQLELDRAGSSIALLGTTIQIGPEEDLERVLERYLSVLALVRDVEPNSILNLRQRDIDVLAAGTETDPAHVAKRLDELIGTKDRDTSATERLAQRLVVPAAGILVVSAIAGTLVMNPLI